MNKFKISLAQLSSKIGDVKENQRQHLEILAQSATQDADVVAFPELSLTGYLIKDIAYEVSRECQAALKQIAKNTGPRRTCIVGFVREDRAGLIENAAAVLHAKAVAGSVAKFYLPTYGLFEEMRYFTAGSPQKDLKSFTANGVRFGVMICEDAWHPEPAEALARIGCDLIFCISSSPARGVHRPNSRGELPIERQWEKLLAAHALMNNAFLIFVNRAGAEDEEYFWGGSMVISPSGEIVAKAKRYEPDLLNVEIDLSEIARSRRFSSFKDHRQTFHKVLESL